MRITISVSIIRTNENIHSSNSPSSNKCTMMLSIFQNVASMGRDLTCLIYCCPQWLVLNRYLQMNLLCSNSQHQNKEEERVKEIRDQYSWSQFLVGGQHENPGGMGFGAVDPLWLLLEPCSWQGLEEKRVKCLLNPTAQTFFFFFFFSFWAWEAKGKTGSSGSVT